MFIQILFTGIIFLFSTVLFLKWMRSKTVKLPPGPPGWPIMGNLPVLFQEPGSTNERYYYNQCARRYGDIYKLQLGPQLMYVLSNFDYVLEAFNHSYLQGRPPGVVYQMVFGPDANGIILSDGPEWKVLKHFTAGVFRELGVGKGVFESNIQSELKRFVKKIDSLIGVPCWNLSELSFLAVSNITCGITFGRQYDYEDDHFKEIIRIMRTYSESMGPSAIVMTNKFLCGLPFGPGKSLRGCLYKFKEFLTDIIEEDRNAPVSDKMQTNFVDAFRKEMDKGNQYFNQGNLITCCVELFFAGSETTSATLSFAILFIVTHPEIQEKTQTELDSFIDQHGMPSYADRSRLPYLQAVILETHRLAIVAPLGVAHRAERDLELFGYDVPKGTLVTMNTGGLLMNEKVFTDPQAFRPERHLKDGCFEALPDTIPFSTGRRACLGEQLARMELFLFLVCLLHRYKFTAPEGSQMPNILEGRYGGSRIPLPYGVIISKRLHRQTAQTG